LNDWITFGAGFGRGASLSKMDIEQLYRTMIVAEVWHITVHLIWLGILVLMLKWGGSKKHLRHQTFGMRIISHIKRSSDTAGRVCSKFSGFLKQLPCAWQVSS
jgi:hypothetical protein